MSNGAISTIALVSLLGAIGAGGFAYYTKLRTDEAIHDCRTQLADCTQIRDTERIAKDSAVREASAAAAAMSASAAEMDELRAEHAETEKRLATFKALTAKFQKMIDSGKLQVVLHHGRMVVKLPAGILFASGSAELSKEGKEALHDVAGVLKQVTDRRFMVAGHTDNVPVGPPTSPFKNNLELSTARALTVAQQLIASGVNPARLVAAGYSQYEPVKANASEAGRQENRRIEIVLLPNITELPLLPGEGAGADAGAPDAGATPNDAGAKK